MRILGDGEVGGKDTTDRHGSKDGTTFFEVEGVGCAEDQGEGSEGQVEDGPGERYPKTKPEYNWLCGEEVCGLLVWFVGHKNYGWDKTGKSVMWG